MQDALMLCIRQLRLTSTHLKVVCQRYCICLRHNYVHVYYLMRSRVLFGDFLQHRIVTYWLVLGLVTRYDQCARKWCLCLPVMLISNTCYLGYRLQRGRILMVLLDVLPVLIFSVNRNTLHLFSYYILKP